MSKPVALVASLALLSALAPLAASDGDGAWTMLIGSGNSFSYNLIAGNRLEATATPCGWGPNWSPWFAPSAKEKTKDDHLEVSSPLSIAKGTAMSLKIHADGPRVVVMTFAFTATSDVKVMKLIDGIGMAEGRHAKAVLKGADGAEQDTDLPAGKNAWSAVASISITSDDWTGPLTITLDPPSTVESDGALRLILAKDALKAGTDLNPVNVRWTFPGDVSLQLGDDGVKKFAPLLPGPDWFPYVPANDIGPSAIGVDTWLDKPAGNHGGVRLDGDALKFADGTRAVFWGTNLAYGGGCAPPRAEADYTAARFAKYGINAVRMHKFTNSGWEGIGDAKDSTLMTADGLDRLDYFADQLAKHGVYYGWSHSYHFKVTPGDKAKVAGFDEIMKKGGDTYAMINWAEDIQDLLIARIVNLLKHKNTYSGKTYAEDPALNYIEIQNEDDIFFWTTGGAANEYPTYKKLLEGRFSAWLKDRYGTDDKLAAAWPGALKPGENLAAGTMAVDMNMWDLSDGLPKDGGARARMLDVAAFLHAQQDRFYARAVKAIRDAGYQGPLVGSPWQTAGGVTHYYNLKSDADVGIVDRHNYFGDHASDTMLHHPGSGMLSSGLQEVAHHPFSVSEWISVYPDLFSAEGPVLMAAYGMGLQGWSMSYEFQSNVAKQDVQKAIVGNLPWGVWNADVPTQVGQYPILARMILRGDVKTSPVISTRRISDQDLSKATFDFAEKIEQNGDVKTFTGTVPAESLAAGRVQVDFVGDGKDGGSATHAASDFPDLAKYTSGDVITAVTGQLAWDAGAGLVEIKTPGTQGFVGFSQGKTLDLGDLSLNSSATYASILVTAAEPKDTIATGKRLLVSAVARIANTGFRYSTLDDKTIVDNGSGPILVEPVQATITLKNRTVTAVTVLDQDGRTTSATVPVTAGAFTIDTGRDKTIYYQVDCQ